MEDTFRQSLSGVVCRSICLASMVLFGGCAHLGPGTIPVDRFDYGQTIADSWKQQTLLNIVKMRYADLPVFVDVASIVAGYSLQTGVSVGGVTSSKNAVQGDYASLGGQAVYTDRPTITYVPTTGEKFLRGLIAPIDPKNIFLMLQSGYPADFVLGMTVESLNGLRNRSTTGGQMRDADPEFMRAAQLMRDVQIAGAVGMRVEEDKARGSTAVLFFRRDDLPVEIVAKVAELRQLLKLPESEQRFALTFSPARGAAGELSVNSRSMLQILGGFASYIDVPEEHIQDHSASPFLSNSNAQSNDQMVRIHSGRNRPEAAYCAVRYRGNWFWIDEGDYLTKRALTAVMYFFTLADTGGSDMLPLVTIPAQ